jgi:hypothetical protein
MREQTMENRVQGWLYPNILNRRKQIVPPQIQSSLIFSSYLKIPEQVHTTELTITSFGLANGSSRCGN